MVLTYTEIQNKVQIIHCSRRKHWIVVTTVIALMMKLNWWFAIYSKLTVLRVVHGDALSEASWWKRLRIFSVAFATAIVLGLNPGKIKSLQPVMRAHLVNCLNKGEMII